MRRIWTETFVWLPVFPIDEQGLFWLEKLWRRQRRSWRWEYRSFREEGEKSAEAARRAGLPPPVH